MIEQQVVDWGNKEEFFKKPENERYQYFKNTIVALMQIINQLEGLDKFQKSENGMAVVANLIFFITFLCTTSEEQDNKIEEVWLHRLKEETESELFNMFTGAEGVA